MCSLWRGFRRGSFSVQSQRVAAEALLQVVHFFVRWLAPAHAGQGQGEFLFPVEQFHQQHHAFLAIHA